MDNTIQLYLDKEKEIKGYPITSPDRVIDENGVNIKEQLDNKANKSEVDNNISEIARLEEIANTWEAFKNNGGEINGGIQAHALKNIYTLTSGEKERCYYFGSLNNFDATIGMEILDKKSGFDTKVELAQGGNPTSGGQGYFGSSHDLITNLGSDNKRWKDVWVGSYSKNANGYTKLPNGIIMQWGHLHLSNDLGSGIIRITVPFPIQFPKDVLRVYLSPNVNEYSVDNEYSGSWERPPVTCRITSSNFEFAFQRIYEHYGAGIDWFAIGY